MPTDERERRRQKFLSDITCGRTREQAISFAAKMLHVSPHTVRAWLKPASSRSANALPMWAVELFEYKRRDPNYAAEFSPAYTPHCDSDAQG